MQATTLFWHVINFAAPAACLGALAAAAARLAWRTAPRSAGFVRLWAWSSAAALLAALAGLVLFAQDGKMLTYALMAVACAAVLVWRGGAGGG